MSTDVLADSSASEPMLGADEELKGRSPRELAWRRFRRNKVGIVAGVFTLGTLLSSLAWALAWMRQLFVRKHRKKK